MVLTAAPESNRGTGDVGSPPARQVRRHRPLPNGRAVIGGFLVSLAAVGLFGAYTGLSARHRLRYVVASRDLAVGHRIAAVDLSTAAMSLPAELANQYAFQQVRTLVGALVVGPLRAGELVQASDVVAGAAGSNRELSFSIDSSRAVNGALQVGDRVDVVATFGSGQSATTATVAQGLTVVASAEAPNGLGSSGTSTEVLTVSLTSRDNILALVQAINAGQVVLVRSTGAPTLPPSQPYQGPTYLGSTVPAP